MLVKQFSLYLEREVISQEKLFFLQIRKLCQKNTTDLTVSTVFLMFTHLYYILPSLEKAPLPPHCILSVPHRGCSAQKKPGSLPRDVGGSVFTKTVLSLGSGELIKTPRINS